MYEPLRNRALTLLKVPPEPHPPAGDPASLRVFRAGRNYYRLRMGGWAIAQVLALAGIVFWTVMLLEVEGLARAEQAADAKAAASAPAVNREPNRGPASGPETRQQRVDRWRKRFFSHINAAANDPSGSRRPIARGWSGFKRAAVEVALLMPPWVFPMVWALKIAGIVLYFVQLGVTYSVRRLDYEMRWYLVTDRSLRLRHGVWTVWESTMSFANIQQVVVSQDPIQRFLGLANVKVQSAGGGTSDRRHPGADMHVGYFHSVTNAEEIRDLILERLRRFRETGLGDPDEKAIVAPAPVVPEPDALLCAARELATEARALRVALGRS